MPFCIITAHLTIDEKDVSQITEALLSFIDSLIVKNTPVYDSSVYSTATDAIADADEIRKDLVLATE